MSGDGSTAALYIFNFGSRAPNVFVAAFYFWVSRVGVGHSGFMIRKESELFRLLHQCVLALIGFEKNKNSL